MAEGLQTELFWTLQMVPGCCTGLGWAELPQYLWGWLGCSPNGLCWDAAWEELGSSRTHLASQGTLPKYGTGVLCWAKWSSKPPGPLHLVSALPQWMVPGLWAGLSKAQYLCDPCSWTGAPLMGCARMLGCAEVGSSGTCMASRGATLKYGARASH